MWAVIVYVSTDGSWSRIPVESRSKGACWQSLGEKTEIPNRNQQPPLSGLPSIPYFSVHLLNSISVCMMDSCRLVLEI